MDLAILAKRYDVGLHVDCCLGGFFLPFAKKLGHNIPGNRLITSELTLTIRLYVLLNRF